MSSPEYFKAVFTVDIVPEAEREKFRGLTRPETYRRIRPHYRVGQRGCYEVEVTPREFTLAMRDALNPDSNLIAAERAVVMETHLVPNQGNRDYAELRRLSEDGYDASGVAIAVIDRGITTAFRDAHFSGRVADAEDFTGEANPYALYGGDEHGCYMASLAIPPEADLIVAKVNLTSDVAEAFYWIADETTAEIVSISLATSTPSTALADAVDYARDAGLLIFASAGNDANTTVNYPSSYDGAHKISNFDHRTDAISPDSTFGADVFGAAGGNDHTVWNASGSEFYIEAGGTSCATAMAARIAAYVVGKFGSGSAISTLTSTARDAGAPDNKQGAGVLRLVHDDDREPPVPVVPVGQSRDFDLELPELPPIDGPGSDVDPSNPTDPTAPACNDATLNSLVSAYEASGSDADRDELIDYVESVRGEAIEDLLAPQWNQTATDGETRHKTVNVGSCSVEFTVDAALVGGGTCSLSTKTMTLGGGEFSLPTIVPLDSFNPNAPTAETSPGEGDNITRTEQSPEITLSVHSVEMVYVANTSPLTAKWDLDSPLENYSGTNYRSAIRVKLSYEVSPRKQTQYTFDYFALPSGEWDATAVWNFPTPVVGLRSVTRYPEGVGPGPYYTDPLEVGSVDTINGTASSVDYYEGTEDAEQRAVPAPGVSGVSHSPPAGASAAAAAAVAAYNTSRGVNDPVLSYDAEILTVSHATDATAIYLNGPECDTATNRPKTALTFIGGGYIDELADEPLRNSRTVGYEFDGVPAAIQRLVQSVDEETCFVAATGFYDRLSDASYEAELSAAAVAGSTDGRPPDTTENPPITPVGGGCKSSVDGPSSCTWTLPDNGDIPLPGDNFDDMPVINTNFPKFPPIGCHFPDFGNMDPCAPGSGPPGMNGPGPGGRDRRGKRGNKHGHVKTGGPTYGNPRKVSFSERTCFGQDMPGISCFTVITMLLMDCGISALDIIFQVTSEYDKPFPEAKCFKKGALKWDAANWTARYLGLHIFDEGKPTNNVYIGPRYHRPGQSTWHFWEHIDFFGYDPVNSSEELYSAVVVFGPDGLTATSLVESPFATEDYPIKYVEVGPNFSQADANLLAAYHASLVRREATSVQVVVPYSNQFFLRDKAVLHAPDRGFETNWIIMGKESDISETGRLHHLTLMLPETVRELDELPTSVGTLAEETPGTEFLLA